MKTILVGLEETEEGRDALKFANLISGAIGAQLHVVSVHWDTIFYQGIEEMKVARNQYFDDMLEFAEGELGEEFEFHRVLETSVPAGLTRISEEIGADLMVIGSSHRGPIGRILMGDAGARLAAGAPCAVAMVPRGWSRSDPSKFGKIGVGFNGTRDSEEALMFGSALSRTLASSLLVVGVVPRMAAAGRIGLTNVGYDEMLRGDMEQTVKDAIAKTDSSDAEGRVRSGFATDELADESVDLDLLVLGSRSYGPVKRVLLGGVSLKVMRSAACPVIVVPKADE